MAAHLATRCVGVSMSVSPFEVGLSPSRKESGVPQLVPQHSNSRADLLLPLPSFGTNYPTKQKVGPSQPEVGPSHSHPSLSAYTRARGMDHSPPITLDAHHGTGRAINRFPSTRGVAKPSKKLAPRRSKVAPQPPTRHDASVCHRAGSCLLYTSPSPRDGLLSRMPSSA